MSVTVRPLSIAIAPEFSVYVAPPPAFIVGASLTGTIVIEEVAATDCAEEESVTVQVIVRLAVGFSTDETKVTERKALCHAATLIPEPLTVRTPVVALYDELVPFGVPTARVSPLTNPAETVTVA